MLECLIKKLRLVGTFRSLRKHKLNLHFFPLLNFGKVQLTSLASVCKLNLHSNLKKSTMHFRLFSLQLYDFNLLTTYNHLITSFYIKCNQQIIKFIYKRIVELSFPVIKISSQSCSHNEQYTNNCFLGQFVSIQDLLCGIKSISPQ